MKIRRVDFSPDEWLAGTRELSLEERGAYWDVCALIYSRGGPVLDDERWLAKALACDVRTWRRIRGRLLAVGKLRLIELDGQAHLINGRAELEIERANGRIEHASRGGKAKAEKHGAAQHRANFGPTSAGSSGDPPPKSGPVSSEINGLGSANHQPSTTNQDVIESHTLTSDAPPAPKAEPKGTRIPEGWEPPEELKTWTREAIADAGAEDRIKPGRVLEEFRDYWRSVPGAKGRKTDWPATWRNRIRALIDREGKPNGSSNHQKPGRRSSVAVAAAFAAGFGGPGNRGPADEGSGT